MQLVMILREGLYHRLVGFIGLPLGWTEQRYVTVGQDTVMLAAHEWTPWVDPS